MFNPSETAGFGIHLLDAGTNHFGGTTNATYDRYTFYRLLSQLGTDTTPESGKMNLNYDNLNPYLNGFPNTNGTASATNFVAWQPLAFFTNAADRMLKTYTTFWKTTYLPNNVGVLTNGLNANFVATFNVTNAFGVTGIPVWVSNRFVYTPAVQRVLQLAANIYDATTTNYYPSVFRPTFTTGTNGNVFITGYTNVPFPSRIPPSLRSPLTPRPWPRRPMSTIWRPMSMACRGSLARRRVSRTSTSSRWRTFSSLPASCNSRAQTPL